MSFLDGKNYFSGLPNEVVVKIFFDLYGEKHINIFTISKWFKDIWNEYVVQFLKENLRNKGLFVENVISEQRLKDIYKSWDLNRICYRIGGVTTYHIVGNDGKIYSITDGIVDNILDIKDIISISGSGNDKQLFLRNDGCVYYSANSNDSPKLVYKSKSKVLSNIIQVMQVCSYSLFLSSKGKIYIKDQNSMYAKLFDKLSNISQISDYNIEYILFQTKDGDVFKYNNQDIVKIENFKNVKHVRFMYDQTVTLCKDKTIRIYDSHFKQINFNLPTNINKFDTKGNLFMLDDKNKLYLHNDGTRLAETDVLDFCLNFGIGYSILTTNNELIVSVFYKKYIVHSGGNIKLLDNEIVLIDNHIYFIHHTTSGYVLVKIC
jgi:hypothetical protein